MQLHNNHVLCEMHFERSMFVNCLEKRLTQEAIPTVFESRLGSLVINQCSTVGANSYFNINQLDNNTTTTAVSSNTPLVSCIATTNQYLVPNVTTYDLHTQSNTCEPMVTPSQAIICINSNELVANESDRPICSSSTAEIYSTSYMDMHTHTG